MPDEEVELIDYLRVIAKRHRRPDHGPEAGLVFGGSGAGDKEGSRMKRHLRRTK